MTAGLCTSRGIRFPVKGTPDLLGGITEKVAFEYVQARFPDCSLAKIDAFYFLQLQWPPNLYSCSSTFRACCQHQC